MKDSSTGPAKPDRRRAIRFPLGLPVRVRLAGNVHAMTVELMDLSAEGGRFRCAGESVQVNQAASFAFVLPGQRHCLARGSVVRTDGSGEFVLRLQGANAEFRGFIGQLAG
jgi:hypothetical protein